MLFREKFSPSYEGTVRPPAALALTYFAKKTGPFMKALALHHERGVIMDYNFKVTCEVIKKLRVEKDLTQEVLSGLAGLARSHLADIEGGRVNPNVDTLWRISEALGMRLSELMQTVEEEIARRTEE